MTGLELEKVHEPDNFQYPAKFGHQFNDPFPAIAGATDNHSHLL
jgi:hypothetical protein